MIEITQKEYDDLVSNSILLSCLEGAGVDNWNDYDEAIDLWKAEKARLGLE